MIYSELEAIGKEGSTDYGDYIVTSAGKSTDVKTVFDIMAIPDYAPYVYFKVGRIIQQTTITEPEIVKVPVDGQDHQISDSVGSMTIYFDGGLEYSIKGSGSQALIFVLYDVFYESVANLDSILSHLADINWPYPTGTVHYYDTSLIDLKTQLHNTPRYAGSELEEGKKCVTNAQYSSPSFTTEHITSNGLVWNSTYVDTTKNNSYWIHKTSGYIDVYLVFYANVTSSSTWTIATINSDIINYGASYDTSYYGFIGNDNYGSFSSVYLVRSGSDGDAGNLQIRGIGMVKKGKNTSGITSSYATYACIRIIPNSWNSTANYELRSTYLQETIEDV